MYVPATGISPFQPWNVLKRTVYGCITDTQKLGDIDTVLKGEDGVSRLQITFSDRRIVKEIDEDDMNPLLRLMVRRGRCHGKTACKASIFTRMDQKSTVLMVVEIGVRIR